MERPFKEHDTSSSMTAAYVLLDMVRATTSSVQWIRLERLDLRGTWSVTLWQGYRDKI